MEARQTKFWVLIPLFGLLAGCAHHQRSVHYPTPESEEVLTDYRQEGLASWYGPGFHGRRTASGERFNTHAMTCAHKSLPFGTRVKVTNLENGQALIVTVNDRGPFIRGRIIDLSHKAAQELDVLRTGVAKVKIEMLAPRAPQNPHEALSASLEVDTE